MKLTILGAGNMGLAFARGLLAKNLIQRENLTLIESQISKHANLEQEFGCVVNAYVSELSSNSIIILAVKPQDFSQLVVALRDRIHENNLCISIMAGQSLSKISTALNNHSKLVRCMPNLAAQLGMSFTAFVSGSGVSQADKQNIQLILGSIGSSIELESEELFNPFTAVSGSGPGYVFYICDSIQKACQNLGFKDELAKDMIIKTFQGALQVWQSTVNSPSELVRQVASKGGGTEAALNVFQTFKLDEIIVDAIKAANKRYHDLSKL